MPVYTAEALILRTYKLGEADRIVVFLTSDRGKRRGVAKGARRTRSNFSGGLEPFTRVRLEYFEREHRELVRLSYVEPLTSPLAIGDSDVLSHASYFAELVDECALEGDPSDHLYRLGASVVEAIAKNVSIERLARYFEYWLLRLQGVYPSAVVCHECGGALGYVGAVIERETAVFVCSSCSSSQRGVELSPESLEFLRLASAHSPQDLEEVALSARASRQLAAAHRVMISSHLDKELKSARVLRELGVVTDSSFPSNSRVR